MSERTIRQIGTVVREAMLTLDNTASLTTPDDDDFVVDGSRSAANTLVARTNAAFHRSESTNTGAIFTISYYILWNLNLG